MKNQFDLQMIKPTLAWESNFYLRLTAAGNYFDLHMLTGRTLFSL
jgi:hypothetical protein